MKRVMVIALVVLMLVSVFTLSVFAEGGKPVSTYGVDMTIIFQEMEKEASGNIKASTNALIVTTKGEPYTVLGIEGEDLVVYPDAIKNAKDKDVTKAFKLFVLTLNEKVENMDVAQQIMADLQDADPAVATIMMPMIFEGTKGDMYTAYRITSPFLGLLSTILGIGVVLLIVLLLFSTVMDLAYIGLPVLREAQGGKEGGKKPIGVSYEALTTVAEVEKGSVGGEGGYKNAYIVYFKRRALTYIVLAICIMYLICGGLSGIISFVLNLVSGVTM